EKTEVQKKVFANWINSHVPNCIKNDIIEELRDGTKLIALIYALSGVKLVSSIKIFFTMYFNPIFDKNNNTLEIFNVATYYS
ncbi:Nesprin-1-like protein, partial [Leptotrombidium deliense]